MRSKKYLNRLNESNVEKICNMVIDRRLEEMKLDEGLGNLGKTARNLAVAGLIGLGSHGHAAAQSAAQAPQQHTTTTQSAGENETMDDLLYDCVIENTHKFYKSFSEEESQEFDFFIDYLEEHDNIKGVYKIKLNGVDWTALANYHKEVAKIARQLNREKKLNDYVLIESHYDDAEYARFVPKSLVKKHLALYINAGLE